jgi:FkbM family methyltransferase
MLFERPRKSLRYLLNGVGRRLILLAAKIYASPTEIETIARLTREKAWYADRGDETLRLDYDLSPSSVVLDVGGYEGAFARDIHCRFGCDVLVFEPIASFVDRLRTRFLVNPRVQIFDYGLAGADDTVLMTLEEGGSSAVILGGVPATEAVQLRDIASTLSELELKSVDLLKVNIEGGEYALMDRLLETGLIERFRHIQIQFHLHVPDAEARMRRIITGLDRTHELQWRYPWVWESWSRRDSA